MGMTLKNIVKTVIEGMEVRGFYSVTDEVFALLHGSENQGFLLVV